MASINSLLVALGPEEDAEDVADELRERDDVVRVDVLEVEEDDDD
ncbi:hypothetical protein HVTV-2_gp74 [Haloarcula virus HVTV-2]|uniref:Uncharacterized protein n=1 Tax=Haloarcula vallismortis tailed virus 1 TaxID=1262528 RepID=L7TGW0_9CAUD|nr:hypothetical protein HVTV1_75 [Haloarcula vallismortis tailed virus 1]AGC34444.1 hypothetical protein HVTV1_75 [Haloarcula vallismortis tailed virus 1]UBF22881.1 hypothetical protein HVTV-2_gp74 [Haloarcula virus HVTV-2]